MGTHTLPVGHRPSTHRRCRVPRPPRQPRRVEQTADHAQRRDWKAPTPSRYHHQRRPHSRQPTPRLNPQSPPLRVLRQVLLFHASACDELTPPIHRAPPGPHTGSSPTEDPPQRAFVPGPPTDPSFDAIVVSFRCVSSGSHMFVFSSHTRPATARRQPQRSPPRLLTDAACGGLESPPPRRPRRTYLHHWHSTDRADDLLHHHHFPSGHTVSGGREPPPPALLEPYVTVSRHTAPTVRRSSASVDLSAPPPRG